MQRVRSKNSKPELSVRKFLHSHGYRFRLHNPNLPGTPDIVLARYRTAIFVHGCFWHRHKNCKLATTPNTNTDFWTKKFNRNVQRDMANVQELEKLNYDVIVVWECEIKKKHALTDLLLVLDQKRRALYLRSSLRQDDCSE